MQCSINGTTQESAFHVSEIDSNEDVPSYLQETYKDGSQNLSPTQQVQFKNCLIKNQSVFARPGEYGRTSLGTHKITLTDETPIKEPPRRVPLFKRHILEKEVNRLEKEGFIEKSNSPWSAQTVLVKTKDGSCVSIIEN